jgi:hypothetical protein
MVVEEKQKLNKQLYVLEIKLLKILPFLTAFIYFINTILSAFGIDISALSYLSGMSLLPIIFMYLSSYVFKFCEYHRIPLHYIVVNNILSIIGYHCNISLEFWLYLFIHCILLGISLFVILYLYLKSRRNEKSINKNP